MEAGDGHSEYDPPERMRRLPSWLASQLARRGAALVGESLAQEGVGRQHFAVMSSLAEQGPASQAALGRRLWIDRSDLHALMTDLERDGLIIRVRDPEDRRRNIVTLTAAGKSLLKRLDRRVDAAQIALLEPLSAAERRELVRLLDRVVSDPPV
jgi:DNA-binding MarR family transcriptional regulator